MKHYIIILLSIGLFTLSNFTLVAQHNRSISSVSNGVPVTSEFDAKHVSELKLNNEHGYINISGWDKETIEIELIVNIETKYSSEAETILELLSFRSRSYSQTLDFKTIFSEDFYSNHPFTINYNVKVPKRVNLNVKNSIGNVRIDSINAEVKLQQSYGNLEINELATDKQHKLKLSFVEGAINTIGDISVKLSNSTLNIANGAKIKGETQYCMASFNNIDVLDLESSTDRLTIVNCDSLTLKGSQLIGKVQDVKTYAFCEVETGQLNISTSANIKELTISNERANTTLSIPNSVSYYINGEVRNGLFIHPDSQLLQLYKEDDNVTFSGKIGNVEKHQANIILFNNDASITIKNR